MDTRFTLKPQARKKSKKAVINKIFSPSQQVGINHEQEAIEYLSNQGLKLLKQNLSCPMGEIDAVMQEGDILVFVEVRYRKNTLYGGATNSISRQKRLKMQRTAYYFLPLLSHIYYAGKTPFCRFDAFCIEGETQQKIWLKNIL